MTGMSIRVFSLGNFNLKCHDATIKGANDATVRKFTKILEILMAQLTYFSLTSTENWYITVTLVYVIELSITKKFMIATAHGRFIFR